MVCGIMIGWERESQGKPAGLRTNTLICLGACMYMMLGTFVSLPGIAGSDPSRIGAQVVSGVGFLGAGTIIRGRGSIHGLTSAATIWVAAAVGVTCGAGFVFSALLFTIALLTVLMGLGRLEMMSIGPCDFKTVEVRVRGDMERAQSVVAGIFEMSLKGRHPLMWVSDGEDKVLRAPLCNRHMRHRGFLMEVWRLRGVESVRYQDGTIPSLPRNPDDVASDTTGNSSSK
jgi:putative Mg2+ transporter-C (MgtC) family protein